MTRWQLSQPSTSVEGWKLSVEREPSELIAILAVSTVSGESLFKRAHSTPVAGE